MSTDNINGTLSSTGNLNGTFGTSGGGGTSKYNDLTNKPQINGNTLEGNKTPAQLGINIPDMTNYYNKSETNTLLDGKANVSDLPDMNNYYDKSETDTLLDGKADTSDLPDMNNYYDKSETDTLLDGKVDNSSFNAASLPITSGSATNTKDYIDSGLSGKADSSDIIRSTTTTITPTSNGGVSPYSYYGDKNMSATFPNKTIVGVMIDETSWNNPAIAKFKNSTKTLYVYAMSGEQITVHILYK